MIGCSTTTRASIAYNAATGEIAYVAGAVVVLYNPKSNKQSKFLTSPGVRQFVTVSFSDNGKYLAAGEVGDPMFLFVLY